jgi:hypothetical protein
MADMAMLPATGSIATDRATSIATMVRYLLMATTI